MPIQRRTNVCHEPRDCCLPQFNQTTTSVTLYVHTSLYILHIYPPRYWFLYAHQLLSLLLFCIHLYTLLLSPYLSHNILFCLTSFRKVKHHRNDINLHRGVFSLPSINKSALAPQRSLFCILNLRRETNTEIPTILGGVWLVTEHQQGTFVLSKYCTKYCTSGRASINYSLRYLVYTTKSVEEHIYRVQSTLKIPYIKRGRYYTLHKTRLLIYMCIYI